MYLHCRTLTPASVSLPRSAKVDRRPRCRVAGILDRTKEKRPVRGLSNQRSAREANIDLTTASENPIMWAHRRKGCVRRATWDLVPGAPLRTRAVQRVLGLGHRAGSRVDGTMAKIGWRRRRRQQLKRISRAVDGGAWGGGTVHAPCPTDNRMRCTLGAYTQSIRRRRLLR